MREHVTPIGSDPVWVKFKVETMRLLRNKRKADYDDSANNHVAV